jgi:hypothetical protein
MGKIVKSDEPSLEAARCRACASLISDPKMDDLKMDVQFEISVFGFEMQDSSDFKFPVFYFTELDCGFLGTGFP